MTKMKATNSSIRLRAGILTVSDRSSQGLREDSTGPELEQILRSRGFQTEWIAVVPDEEKSIQEMLVTWADQYQADLILTTGGTGLSPRDVTPEATSAICERLVPGMAEAMRAESLKKTPHAMISRAVAGVRGRTLIVNLPGSPRGARENLEVVLPALEHAISKLQGDPSECATP
jgi:molybdopterin adenylyltransferase